MSECENYYAYKITQLLNVPTSIFGKLFHKTDPEYINEFLYSSVLLSTIVLTNLVNGSVNSKNLHTESLQNIHHT